MTDELDIEILPETQEPIEGNDAPDYAWLLEDDTHLRTFIVKHYASGAHEIDGRILISNMEAVFKWIKEGVVPPAKRNTALKAVSGDKP